MSETQVIATEVIISETGKPKIICEFCSISFGTRGNLYTHLRKYHQFKILVQGNQICPVCSEKFRTLSLLHEHLQNEHSIPLKFVDETFYSKKDFLDWKSKIEKETQSAYRIRNTRGKDSDVSYTYYICHRSGHYRIKQNRIRHVKSTGSIKTGSTCPAVMIVSTETVDGISEIKVHYQSVHIGHDLETRTLRLTKNERENLAACLKLGIPFDKILEDAKQNFAPTNRYNFLTRKHLHNICRDFGIQINHQKPQERKKERKKKNAVQNNDVTVQNNDLHNICRDVGIQINHKKPQEKKKERKKKNAVQNNDVTVQNNDIGVQNNDVAVQNNDVEISDNSIVYEDFLDIEISNHEEIIQEEVKEQEKTSAVTSLLQLHNPSYFEEINDKKIQIINQLKDLMTRIEKWDPTCFLPDIEEHIKAINARLDISEPIK
ncbi:hypothetical protein HNY73_016987 [Argiope bruennichi]|uniref:C2H2-type domain-containing protein n=1 Tax=Argiope bruennichi TaxID=94029 RepID=A0A8T0ELH7_ARGBR|nr:hypothetical protein HNY73_016987 [Argiope bruennichi]